jgi:hypothetical protein
MGERGYRDTGTVNDFSANRVLATDRRARYFLFRPDSGILSVRPAKASRSAPVTGASMGQARRSPITSRASTERPGDQCANRRNDEYGVEPWKRLAHRSRHL